MNIAAWIVAGLLAVVFLVAGLSKIVRPREQLRASGMGFVEDFTGTQIKLIGLVEVLGAIGVILPQATGVARVLTPLAATCLGITMLLAGLVHIRRGELRNLATNVVLLSLAVFVASIRY